MMSHHNESKDTYIEILVYQLAAQNYILGFGILLLNSLLTMLSLYY